MRNTDRISTGLESPFEHPCAVEAVMKKLRESSIKDLHITDYRDLGAQMRKHLRRHNSNIHDWYWALIQLKDGRSVRRRSWTRDEYLPFQHLAVASKVIWLYTGNQRTRWLPEIEDFDGLDWEVLSSTSNPPITNNAPETSI